MSLNDFCKKKKEKKKKDTDEQAFIDFIGSGKSVKVVHVTN